MNIVLIGYRGTGKSIVAQELAARLQMQAISMDAEIVRLAGMSIPQIVEKFGWDRFREMESEVARAMALKDNVIVDTGGGVIERSENIAALGQSGLIFWLQASVDVIVGRIEGGTERPALVAGKTFTEEVAEVLARRTPKYAAACHHAIDTDRIAPEQVAAAIITLWEKKKTA
ncbi:MAG: shikimate kinase [Deltaproteobacteria bacterium RIFOXYD12_FULL_57_12]|nr:MAG: shikimate kinase [Deltaproteobacteria bacterium RIFOXYD12_FULL_57_12]